MTANEFEDWANHARAAIDPDKLPEAERTPLERSARVFLLRNERIPKEERDGLQIIHDDHERRAPRHWRFGMMLFVLLPLIAVVLLCVSGERNPVLLGFGAFLGVGLALYIGGGLLQPAVLRQFRRAAAVRRAVLVWNAWKLASASIVVAQNKKLFVRCAVIAYLTGSALDLWASRP